MTFCPSCESLMTRMIVNYNVNFLCNVCGRTREGTPKDTLVVIVPVGGGADNSKYETFVDNAPYDQAGYKQQVDCPKCGLDFMSVVILPPNETMVYVCDCGYQATLSEHNNATQSKNQYANDRTTKETDAS